MEVKVLKKEKKEEKRGRVYLSGLRLQVYTAKMGDQFPPSHLVTVLLNKKRRLKH
jgi:hypothetical protein